MNIGIKSLLTGALLLLAGPVPSGLRWAELRGRRIPG
jgi:hypothetical protein